MTKYLRRKILKFFVYAVIVFISYIIQSTPGFLEFQGVKPILVLPACICLAIYEGEFAGGLFGFFAGIFCDSAAETVFGFNALFYLILCAAAGLFAIYLFRRNTLNILLVCLIAIFARSFVEFFFSYLLYSYEGLSGFFYLEIAPQIVYSSIFSLPYCLLFRWLHKKFEPEEARE